MAIQDSSMRGIMKVNYDRLARHLRGLRVAANRVFSLIKEVIQTMDFQQDDNSILKARNKLTS